MSEKRKRKSETNVPAVHKKRKLKNYFLSEQENENVDKRSESDNEGKNSGWVFDEYLSSDSDTEDENSAFCVECVEKSSKIQAIEIECADAKNMLEGKEELNTKFRKLRDDCRDLYFDIKPTPGSWHCF